MPRLTRHRFDSLLRFLNRSALELKKCDKSGAYLAGCVLLGAALEYTLNAMIRMFPHRVYARGYSLKHHWTLAELNRLARDCHWFDEAAFNAAERIRHNRNLLHPNWYASSKPPRITKYMLGARLDDYNAAIDSLLTPVMTWLRMRMERHV